MRVPSASQPSRATFDVCHVGVVLRVVLGVQVVLCLGLFRGLTGVDDALHAASQAVAVGLPASLLWLVGVCGARAWLARQASRGVATVLALWGALAALYGFVQFTAVAHWSGQQRWDGWTLWPVAAIGAGLAWMVHAWLDHRQQRLAPALQQALADQLQARIQPHFLFNALNTAIALVQDAPAQAEAVLEDLSELFRRALALPAARSILRDEVDLARRYLAIEQLRFGARMRVDWQVDDDTLEAVIPALSLQPLVENAVRHGIERMTEGGWVRISARRKGAKVHIDVSNAVPAPTAEVPGVIHRAGHGMALDNVRQRLLLMHDIEADLQAGVRPGVPSPSDAEFRVSIRIPAPTIP